MKNKLAGWVYLAQEFKDAARETQADALWMSGTEKHTGAPLKVFYFGSGRSFDHLCDKLFAGYVTYDRAEEDQPVWRARHWLANPGPGVDLVIGDLPWPYYKLVSRSRFAHVPGWIVQKLPLAASWDDVVASFRKNTRSTDLRKIRKHKLAFRLTQDRAQIERFYDTMYLPYTEKRFAGLAVIDDREEIISIAMNGTLLQVVQEDKVLAAVVLTKWEKSMHFLWFGLPEGLEEALQDSALSGIYYFTIQHAHAQGCDEVNFSYTVPLLNDGIYRYKRKWGAGVHAWPFARILMRPLNFGPAVASFLEHAPPVVCANGGLVGKMVVGDAELSVDKIKEIAERYACNGLRRIEVFSTQPVSAEVRGADYGELAVRVVDLSSSKDAAAEYCAN